MLSTLRNAQKKSEEDVDDATESVSMWFKVMQKK